MRVYLNQMKGSNEHTDEHRLIVGVACGAQTHIAIWEPKSRPESAVKLQLDLDEAEAFHKALGNAIVVAKQNGGAS